MQDFDDRAERELDAFGRHPVLTVIKWALGGGIVAAVLAAVIGVVSTGSVFFQAGRAKLVAPAEVTRKVYDPNNIVGQVAFFTQTCEDVSKDYANWRNNEAAYNRELRAAEAARTQGEATQASDQAQQLNSYVAGAIEQLQTDAADYNARSINYTANPFKSRGLPYRITVPADLGSGTRWTPPGCG